MRALLVLLMIVVAYPATRESDRAHGFPTESLKAKNPEVGTHAVQALGLVPPQEPYLSQLEAMLDDKDVAVRVATITSPVDLQKKCPAALLQKALASDGPEVSFAAAKGLWSIEEPLGREALISVLSGETKTQSGFFTRQKRDAVRMMHTPKTMFLFVLRQGMYVAPVPGLGAGVSSLQGILSDANVSGRAPTPRPPSTHTHPPPLPTLTNPF